MPPTGVSSKAEKSLALFWGCELNWDNRSYTFDPLEDDKTGHKLMLNVICIGEKNNNDVNVVEIVPPPDEDGRERRALPIATLKLSVLPMANISGMELTPPITFHLRSGSGPVYISGRDLTVNLDPPLEKGEGNEEEAEEDAEEEEDDDYDDDDEDDDDGDDDNDDDDDDSNERSLEETPPPKPAKRRASNTQAGGVAKKKKLEDEHRVPSLRSPEMKAKGKKAKSRPRK